MCEVIVAEHALKHGISANDIEHAWNNFIAKAYRGAPNEGEVIAVGYDGERRIIEMGGGAERRFGVVIFHAIAPPTRKILAELGIEGRRPWRR